MLKATGQLSAIGFSAMALILGVYQGAAYAQALVDIYGVANVQYYDFAEDADGKISSNTDHESVPTFQAFTFHVSFESDIREDADIFVDCEWEDGKDTKCERIQLTWRMAPSFAVRTGKFTSPIGIEGELHYASIRKFPSRPFVSRQVVVSTWPDVGLVFFGEVPVSKPVHLRYSALVTNGLKGPARGDRQIRDNNANKLLGLRLGIAPFGGGEGYNGYIPLRGLELGGYYATEKYDDAGEFELNFTGGYLSYDSEAAHLRGEYIISEVEEAAGTKDRSGYYAQAGYKVLQNTKYLYYLESLIRYDTIDLDEDVDDNTDRSRFTVGMNISPFPHFLFKTEYQWTHENEDPQLKNNGFMLEAVMDF